MCTDVSKLEMERIGRICSVLIFLGLFEGIITDEMENMGISENNFTITFPTDTNYESNTSCADLCRICTSEEKEDESATRKPGEKILIFISALYDGPEGGWDGSGCIPAIEMAFDDINARTDILPQYELRPIWNDTKVE